MYEKKRGKGPIKNKIKPPFFISLGVVFIILVCFVFFLRSDYLQIEGVTVSGNRILGEEELALLVKNITEETYFHIIPKTSSILYPKKDITNELLAYSARIKSVNITKEGLKKSVITISEREPLYVWCEGGAETEKKCLYIDADGIAFAFAPRFSPGIVFEFSNSDTEKKALIGTEVIDPKDVLLINNFRFNLATSTPLSPIAARVLPSHDYEIETKEGPVVLFSKKEDPKRTAAILNTFFLSVPAKEVGFIERPGLLDRIDLRFGQKIFYTLSNRE
jgi:hypothetical protein